MESRKRSLRSQENRNLQEKLIEDPRISARRMLWTLIREHWTKLLTVILNGILIRCVQEKKEGNINYVDLLKENTDLLKSRGKNAKTDDVFKEMEDISKETEVRLG